MQKYLEATEIIDYNNPKVKAHKIYLLPTQKLKLKFNVKNTKSIKW